MNQLNSACRDGKIALCQLSMLSARMKVELTNYFQKFTWWNYIPIWFSKENKGWD